MSSGPFVHPTALISEDAQLADGVVVGPYVIIEGRVRLGPDCEIKSHAHLEGPLTMGRGNKVFQGAVIGSDPQHLKYGGETTALVIGDNNVFREHVTVHRGTGENGKTVIGNKNYMMVNSHVGHDCVIGNGCILTNGSLVAGHCVLGDGVYLSGNSAVHQHVRIGRLALISGVSATTKDVPPFIMQQYIDSVVGINVVGMRRAGMLNAEIREVREAFKVLFRESLPLPAALDRLKRGFPDSSPVKEIITFLEGTKRGISPMRDRFRETAA